MGDNHDFLLIHIMGLLGGVNNTDNRHIGKQRRKWTRSQRGWSQYVSIPSKSQMSNTKILLFQNIHE